MNEKTVSADQAKSLLEAARTLLAQRGEQMVTIEEWIALARAVASCTGTKTALWLTPDDFEVLRAEDGVLDHFGASALKWDPERDGVIPEDPDQ